MRHLAPTIEADKISHQRLPCSPLLSFQCYSSSCTLSCDHASEDSRRVTRLHLPVDFGRSQDPVAAQEADREEAEEDPSLHRLHLTANTKAAPTHPSRRPPRKIPRSRPAVVLDFGQVSALEASLRTSPPTQPPHASKTVNENASSRSPLGLAAVGSATTRWRMEQAYSMRARDDGDGKSRDGEEARGLEAPA